MPNKNDISVIEAPSQQGSSPLLSICIPTYNRLDLLKKSLSRLEDTVKSKDLFSCVEVVVSNNCSNDGTREFLDRYARESRFSNLKITNRLENIGADRNFLALLNEASGMYCWLVSDDDLVTSSGLTGLVEKLSAESPGYVVLNVEGMDGGVRCFDFADGPCLDIDDLCLNTRAWLTFLSIMVIRRSELRLDTYLQRIGTYMLQSYIFLDVASRSQGFFFVSFPSIRFRPNETGGYSFFEVFIDSFFDLLAFARLKGLSASAYFRISIRHLLGFVLIFAVKTRAFGSTGRFTMKLGDSLKELSTAFFRRPWLGPLLLPLLGVVLIPPPLLRAGFQSIRRSKTAAGAA